MQLPFDLMSKTYRKPNVYLCETDKKRICALETIELKGSFKFNTYSELTFTVARTYTNMITGETQVNPFYDRLEALRLIFLEGFGYFEIQDPEINSDGIREVKNITAYSLEYSLSQKYLENFKINTGEIDSLEVINSTDDNIIPISLYNEGRPELSLLDLCLEKVYGWRIGHVDSSLKTMGRTFDISRESIYDFIVQDICEKFNCFAIFDTINNTINLYAESLITKFIGDGTTTTFTLSSPYSSLGTVSIDSYKTTAYTYNPSTGKLVFDEAPVSGAKIEVTDGSQEQWTTDVYVSFDNLAQEVNVSYSADDIKTVLTVKGADDLDIREVNMGLPYIVDLSYYYSVDWMGQDLYDAYTLYLQKYDDGQEEYQSNSEKMLDLNGHITYEKNRLSLQYSIADHVNNETVGTYYVRGGAAPDYYYTEVKLPAEYNSNVEHYYMLSGSDLDETKFANFYEALKTYYTSQNDKDISEIEKLKNDFVFVEAYTIVNLVADLKAATTTSAKDTAVKKFLDEVFNQLGLTPLKTLYYEPYNKIKTTNEEAGWSDTSNSNYWNYYPVTVIISAIEKEITDRENTIDSYQKEYDALANRNKEIADAALIYNNFTKEQLIRLSPFLREDEYTDDNFVITDIDGPDNIMQMKKELRECGCIELAKLCEPKLEFSMDMANIYALPDFAPIVYQFQLGNLINVVIRPDYVKRARLLAVDINFDDFSDFTCEFGELTNLKTPSSIHADLLASALTAGKSVASNASYWNKGSEAVTSLSLLIQQGLLDANTVIKSIDGVQGTSIDQYGIHLRKYVPDTGALDPKEGWIVNNQFLYSDDNFRASTKSVFGEYQIGDQTKWGLLAEAVMAGYIAGCTIEGGTIDIGEGTFMVDESGNVTINAGTIKGYAKNDNLISSINASPEEVAIDSSKISLTGKNIDLTSDNITINSTNFSVTKEGKITATSGNIAGWNITNSYIDSTVEGSKKRIYLASASDSSSYWVRTFDENENATFSLTKEGKLIATGAELSGKITATDGKIGGWNINTNSLTNVYNSLGIGFCNGASDTNLIAAGIPVGTDDDITTMSWGDAPFRVTRDGSVYATKGILGGWNITNTYIDSTVAGSTKRLFLASASDTSDSWMGARDENGNYVFVLSKSGKLYASNAEIAGKITATSGNIGGFSLNTYSLDCTKDGKRAIINSNSIGISGNVVFGVYDGSSWTAYIDGAGKLVSSNAVIAGNITATSGTIGGCSITNGVLKVPSANITGTITANSISVDNFSASSSGVSIAGWAVDNNSIRTGTLGSSGSMWLVRNGSNSSATIGNRSGSGWCIGINSNFGVTSGGALYCSSGNIGAGMTIGSLSTGTNKIELTTSNVYCWTSGSTRYSGKWHDIVRAGIYWNDNLSSDRRIKNSIEALDLRYEALFDNLKPVRFKFNDGDSGRYHTGFIAQEVKDAMDAADITTEEFACFCIDDEGTEYEKMLIRKDEIIALCVSEIQKLKSRLTALEGSN